MNFQRARSAAPDIILEEAESENTPRASFAHLKKTSAFRVPGPRLLGSRLRATMDLASTSYVDESASTDSGFCSLEVATTESPNLPTTFPFISLQDDTPKSNAVNSVDKRFHRLKLQERKNSVIRKPLADRTNFLSNSPGDLTYDDESPKSRNPNGRLKFMRQNSSSFLGNSTLNSRKRSVQHTEFDIKRIREEREAINENEPCTSSQPASKFHFPAKLTSFKRTQSCSAIESQSPPDLLSGRTYALPVLPKSDHVAFKRVTAETVAELARTMSAEDFAARFLLVDCRYPYEYAGGHIKHAVSIFDGVHPDESYTLDQSELVLKFFFPECPHKRKEVHSKIPIFYCEYSQKRGPLIASTLRSIDRLENSLNYPDVSFSEIYVIDKGYKNFFQLFSYPESAPSPILKVFEPCGYVEMHDTRYQADLKRYKLHRRGSAPTMTSMREIHRTTSLRSITRKLSSTEVRRLNSNSPQTQSSPLHVARGNLFSDQISPAQSAMPPHLELS